MLYDVISAEAEAIEAELRELRRDFHRHPELAWEEMRTTSLIAAYLTELGFDEVITGEKVCLSDARMALPSEERMEAAYQRAVEQGGDMRFLPGCRHGFTGVIGILRCGNGEILNRDSFSERDNTALGNSYNELKIADAKIVSEEGCTMIQSSTNDLKLADLENSSVVAFRFDIDALPIIESENPMHFPFKEGFRSENEGVMHACGHDGHITVGLGTAKLLAQHRNELKGTVKFIFQPSEEGVRGAKSIAENHHLDDVSYVFGSHMADVQGVRGKYTDSEVCVGFGPGGSLATTKIDVIFTGTASHAAMSPEKGDNALLAAVTAVQNLHAIPRYTGADTRVNVGKIEGGTARNIICEKVRMELEVRGETSEANQYMEDYAKRILQSAAAMHNCTVEIQLMGAAKSVCNDIRLNQEIQQVLHEKMHLQAYVTEEKLTGSEDYSYLSDAVQSHGGESSYFYNYVPCAGPFHSAGFDFDERALVNGVKAFCGIGVHLLKEMDTRS